jgi:UDP-N-acetylmuramate dehydrogenase
MKPKLQRNVPLAPYTTWKIGGPAQWFLNVETEEALRSALLWAKENHHPVHLLGRGSNVLIDDNGLKGLVLCLRGFLKDEPALFTEEEGGKARLEVSAGLALPRLAKLAASHGYAEYSFYIGIPGTVGGAVAMNAGFGAGDERQTANRCREVLVLTPEGEFVWRSYAAYHPVYRHSAFLDNEEVIVRARFRLAEAAEASAIRKITAEHLSIRRLKQPLSRPTAGSVFKAAPDGTPAAVFIDRCGLKGFHVGAARVSPKHANWIENMGKASAKDVWTLIRHVQRTVVREEGLNLEPEVRFLR